MRRAILPLTVLLSAVTTLTFVGAAVSLQPPGLPPETDGPSEAANRTLVYAFYDAVNAAIQTGELTALAPLVAPELLAGDPPHPDATGSLTLGRRLRALNATSPALHLTVETLAVDGDLVIAHIRAERPGAPAFLGLRLTDAPEAWGPIDLLRIVDSRIVEHRSPAAGSSLLEPAGARTRDLPPDVRLIVTVRRLRLAVDARLDTAPADWFRFLYVERGAVTVTIGEFASYPASTMSLRPADHAIVPAGVAYAVQNHGNEPATLLDLRADRVTGPPPAADRAPATAGVGKVVVGSGHITGPASGEVALSLGRSTLAPHARLAWSGGAGPVLLCVETGTVRLDADPDVPWRLDGTTSQAITPGDGDLGADTCVVISAEHAVALSTAGAPATLLIVTLLPVDVLSATDVPRG